uniref:GM08338p n=1 Tax=Drosophila melanogaster TaxID=7227 RepID=Q8MRK0_DROME|nr:GM08338p [Drosophila melanogaster]
MQSTINFMENHLLAARSLCLFRTSADEFSVLNLTLFSPSFQLIL